MSDASLNDLLAELNSDSSAEETPVVEETKTEETADDLDALLAGSSETKDEEAPAEPQKGEDALDGLLVGEKPEPLPEPVKKPRGRPKGSTTKAKTAAAKKAEEPTPVVTEEAPADTPVVDAEPQVAPVQPDNSANTTSAVISPKITINNTVGEPKVQTGDSETRDIYLETDAQILNGHVYRRGQKITFKKGDKFYNSQTDRNGKNWLDHIDDLDYQYAYFGKIIALPKWDELPLGSTEGIKNPALALLVAKIAQEEYERNGVPYN